MLNDPNCKVKPDWQSIYLDETRYWNLADADKPLIEKMIGVYVYDRNSVTYCCEVTPSYAMIHLYNSAWVGVDCTDEDRKRIHSDYVDAAMGSDDDVRYMHARDVDRIPDSQRKSYGELSDADADDRGEAEVREYWQGNCPF